jgi:phosphinothricin acetyltransferase
MMNIRIREMQPEDWEEVAKIYLEGIQTGVATFQTEVPSWSAWDEGHLKECRLAALNED